jgi:hypothetical protein
VTIPRRCPCCGEVIDAYGCACSPSHAWPALSNRTGRIDLNPDNALGITTSGNLNGNALALGASALTGPTGTHVDRERCLIGVPRTSS